MTMNDTQRKEEVDGSVKPDDQVIRATPLPKAKVLTQTVKSQCHMTAGPATTRMQLAI